ncbi:MEG11-like protein [Mya arenaria]|uniref:MEG11-like protein n=1 Tax=Mya arenaria TaxID=6604 RepID=A0ABY7DSW3_MYAAR|nr:MEG11-like protein [Mya arenaria]
MIVVLWRISFLCLVLLVAGVPGSICSGDRDGIVRYGPGCELPCFCKDRGECDQTSGTCKAGCAPGMFGPSCQYRDIAHDQMKNARHSDNLEQHHRYADLAVDDNLTTCSSTDFANKLRTEPPWWLIWFPFDVSFSYIEMTIKKTSLRFMSNFTVSVKNMSEHQGASITFWPSEEHLCYSGDGFDIEKDSHYVTIKLFCSSLSMGNTIKITLGSTNTQLELCDVNIKQGGSIAHGKRTSSSPAKKGNASNVVDGSLVKVEKNCFVGKNPNPWWQVDLGGVSSIRELRLTPFYQKSFSGYKVNISTHENYSSWKTVYNDSSSGQKYVQLTFAARHIRIYRPGKTKLSLCEVEVYEVCGYRRWGDACEKECYCGGEAPCDMYTACDKSMHGQHCSTRCNKHCSKGCNKSDGKCSSCEPGYHGDFCNEPCVNNTFGPNCSNKCTEHCTGQCDNVNGICTMCSPGYKGQFCNEAYDNGTFGRNCLQNCSNQCSGPCNKELGTCNSCQPGYQGNFCRKPCDNNTYGLNCGKQCSDQCFGHCNTIDGACTTCEPGFEGQFCNNSCVNNTFGPNCSYKCNEHCTGQCDNVNGICTMCSPGYKGQFCNEACDNGTFGRNCLQNCSNQCSGPCNKELGTCNSCQPGYQGNFCRKPCDNNTYGLNCGKQCSDQCFGHCNTIDGTCTTCEPGFEGQFCNNSCTKTKWGMNCNKTCGQCATEECNSYNGFCETGCKAGYQLNTCNEPCDNRSFGVNCSGTCNSNCKGPCNKTNGLCMDCQSGWNGSYCDKNCPGGYYGSRCIHGCGYCLNSPCDRVSGNCSEGCKPGYQHTPKCFEKCPIGTFGLKCLRHCSVHCDRTCDRVRGHCSCQTGYQLPKCIYECELGTWGKNCDQTCGGCHAENCSKTDGHCLSGCKYGYKISSDCMEKCDDGKYGYNCSESCSRNCEDPTSCNTTTGFCGSCKRGWQGAMCSERCPDQRYGQNCQEKCGHCAGATCNIMDGHCISCIPGYINDGRCKTGCEAGSHGVDCQERCGMCAGNKSCHPENGTCPLGCKTGFSGDGCTQNLQAPSEPLIVAIAGAVGGGVLIITVIAVTVVVLLIKRINKSAEIRHPGTSKAQTKSSDDPEESGNKQRKVYFQDKHLPVAPTDDPVVVLEPTYGNMSGEEGQSPPNPVTLSQLLSYIGTKSADQTYFSNEYTKIPTGMIHPATAARDPENAGKSRYKNLYAYDHSRVHLKKQQGETDYINACFIQAQYGLCRHLFHSGTIRPVSTLFPIRHSADCIDTCFIQAQYRLYRHLFHSCTVGIVSTLVSFRYSTDCIDTCSIQVQYARYRHLFQSGTERPVSTLVPFRYSTACTDTCSIKVQYELYRHLFHLATVRTVSTLVSFRHSTDCIDTCFIQTNPDVARSVRQFHYTAWPDKDVPDSPASLLMFWHTVRAYDPQRVAPWLVHCSAGVGRTGTFIAMDILHSHGNKTGVLDVFQCVHTLRDQRVNMVQTLSQYKFLHEVMYEALVLSSWPVPIDEFPNEHQRLIKVDPVLNKTNILLEYENEKAYQTMVLSKIRLDSYGQEMDTLFERYAFVVSQTPLEETLVDFCRLIHDLDIRIVVSFPDEGREQVGKLPTSGSSTIGPFTVRFEKEKTSDSIIHRKYSLTNKTGVTFDFTIKIIIL